VRTKLILSLLLVFGIVGCAKLNPFIKDKSKRNASLSLPDYSGLKASMTVADFEVKNQNTAAEVAASLHRMLVESLSKTNRYVIIDPKVLSAVNAANEQTGALAPSEGTQKKEEAEKPPVPDLIVSVNIVEFQPQASGGASGVGGGGGVGSGTLGALLGAALNRAHMILDVRVIERETSKILASTKIQAQASDTSGPIMENLLGATTLGNGLGAFANTPMEKVIRICLSETVRYIYDTVPLKYYKQ
jgi:curli biogenesis system outer membrane secretion channel CsgG